MTKPLLSLVLVCSLLGFSPVTFAEEYCTSSKNSCEAYRCLEDVYRCGKRGYLTHYGLRKCETYLQHQDSVSPALNRWFKKVRHCLQESLIISEFDSCDQISDFAFESHIGCYVSTGYCDLSRQDQLHNLYLIGLDAFNLTSLITGAHIEQACRLRR